METLCLYEVDGPGLPSLFPVPLAADPRQNPGDLGAPSMPVIPPGVTKHHPHLVSTRHLEMFRIKSHLAIRMVDSRITQELLLQVNFQSFEKIPGSHS